MVSARQAARGRPCFLLAQARPDNLQLRRRCTTFTWSHGKHHWVALRRLRANSFA